VGNYGWGGGGGVGVKEVVAVVVEDIKNMLAVVV
jgi:hypothetical protein